MAVKRALDIIIHLQARLRMDVGGRPAQVLSEFYASIFAQILQASQSASQQKFEHAIECVRNVRDAWRQVARGEGVPAADSSGEATPATVHLPPPPRTGRPERSTVRVAVDVACCERGAHKSENSARRNYPATVSSSSNCCFP
jgi:uncharacterized protein with gpF-like domain